MLTTTRRKKRFVRDSSVSLQLTDRDIKIIKLVYQCRFISSDCIIGLLGGSRKGILNRLHLLFHHAGFLDRPKAQIIG